MNAFPFPTATSSSLAANQVNFDTLWKYVCPMMKQIDDLTRETQNLRLMVSKLQQDINFLNKEQACSPTNSNYSAKVLRMQAPASAIEGCGALKKQIPSVHQFPLPDDVLRIVFVNCLPNAGEAAMKAREAPLALGSVCSAWRRVAWSTQELWNTFEIEIPTLIGQPFHQLGLSCDAYVGGIGDWIKRSGKLPLYISLIDKNPLDWELSDGRKELLHRVIGEISSYLARWRSIRFDLPASIIKSHLPVNLLDLSALEMLGVRNLGLGLGPLNMTALIDNRWLPVMQSNSRRLRSLHLSNPQMVRLGHTVHVLPSFAILRWDNLLDLSICASNASPSLNVSDAYSIMQTLAASATQLRSCRMTLRSSELVQGHQICLPSLQEFAITLRGETLIQDTDHRLSPFFSYLKCPSLRSFLYRADMESVLPFHSFLKETIGLKKLHVGSIRVRWDSQTLQLWQECLQACPQIIELHMSTKLSDLYFADISSVLPSLEVLVLDCTPPLDRIRLFQTFVGRDTRFSEPILRRFIERDRRLKLRQRIELVMALCRPGKDLHGELQLKEVRFRLGEQLRDEALRYLSPVITMGLRVTFKSDYYDIPPPLVQSLPLREGWRWSEFTNDI